MREAFKAVIQRNLQNPLAQRSSGSVKEGETEHVAAGAEGRINRAALTASARSRPPDFVDRSAQPSAR